MAETMKMYHHCNPQPFYDECPNQRFCDRIENMKKITEAAWKKCSKCGKTENQIKAGYNASGSQRCNDQPVSDCSIVELDELYWFLEYKPQTETRENVYIMTMVSR